MEKDSGYQGFQNSELERLAILSEEIGEVSQVISSIILVEMLIKDGDISETNNTARLLNSYNITSKEILKSDLPVYLKKDFLILNLQRFSKNAEKRKYKTFVKNCLTAHHKKYLNSLSC